MPSALSSTVRDRIATARGKTPAWRPYLDLVEAVLEEDASGRWDAITVEASPPRPGEAPLLEGATVSVPEKAAARFVATILGARTAKALDPLFVLAAAARQDSEALEKAADGAGVGAEGLEALAGLAASPMLRACSRRLATKVPSTWREGWCPVCGAWPALGELRGLERERHLRCGRCAAGWRFPWLRCAHCGEADEKSLSHLVLEDDPGGRRVETCGTCHGYVKSVATLSALSPADLALVDLETVDLDLAAQERGRRLPKSPAVALHVRVVGTRG